jgi:hypothetical protein
METKAKWNVSTTIEKFNTPEDFNQGNVSEISKFDGNMLLTVGVTDLWNLVIGANNQGGAQEHYDNSHAYIGVGSSAEGAVVGQTGLWNHDAVANPSGTPTVDNTWYKPMDATYPQVSTNKVIFKSTFTGTGSPSNDEASFQWSEWSVARGTGAYVYATYVSDPEAWITTNIHKNLNRRVEEMGTKAPAATWVITVEIQLL